jgi:hypothetical protein
LRRYRYRGGDDYNEDQMKPSTLFLLVAVGFVTLPQTAQGQRIASLMHFAVSEVPVLATTGAFLGLALCELSETTSGCGGSTVAVTLGGAVFGGLTGAIVGGFFPAPHARPLRGHARRAALLGASAGALWGFGVFPHFCLNGCSSGEVAFALSNTAAGALAGLIVGH